MVERPGSLPRAVTLADIVATLRVQATVWSISLTMMMIDDAAMLAFVFT